MQNRARFPFLGSNGILYDKIDPNLGNTNPAPGFISLAQNRSNLRRPDARYANVAETFSLAAYPVPELALRTRAG